MPHNTGAQSFYFLLALAWKGQTFSIMRRIKHTGREVCTPAGHVYVKSMETYLQDSKHSITAHMSTLNGRDRPQIHVPGSEDEVNHRDEADCSEDDDSPIEVPSVYWILLWPARPE